MRQVLTQDEYNEGKAYFEKPPTLLDLLDLLEDDIISMEKENGWTVTFKGDYEFKPMIMASELIICLWGRAVNKHLYKAVQKQTLK